MTSTKFGSGTHDATVTARWSFVLAAELCGRVYASSVPGIFASALFAGYAAAAPGSDILRWVLCCVVPQSVSFHSPVPA